MVKGEGLVQAFGHGIKASHLSLPAEEYSLE